MVIDNKNNVFTCEENYSRVLGTGEPNDKHKLTQILGSRSKYPNIKAKEIAANYGNICILDFNNNIWVCGPYYLFLPGPEETLISYSPVLIEGNAKMITVESDHMMIIDFNNDVFVCGDNLFGQLGLNNCVKYQRQSNISRYVS